MTNAKLKPGLSLLDWLWENYSKFQVSNKANGLVTIEELVKYVDAKLREFDFEYNLDLKEEGNNIVIRVIDHLGTVTKKLEFTKGALVTKFEKFISTQEDVDKGHATKVGDLYLTLQDSLELKYYICLDDLKYKGLETESIVTSVNDGKVASMIKINNPILEKSVDIKTTTDGIRADIVIDSETSSSISIEKSSKGISCHYKWLDEDTEIHFLAMTYNEYQTLPKIDPGSLYFITDLPCIMFRKIKYASSTALIDYVTKEEAKELFNLYNEDLNANVAKLRSDVDIQSVYIKSALATLAKLEGPKTKEGSILNIVTTEISKSLNWEILNNK